MMTRHETLALLLVSLLAIPGAALAQGHHGKGGQQMMDMGQGQGMMGAGMTHGGMMGMMSGPTPSQVLRQKEALNLTAPQVERLETIQKEMAEAREAHMTEVMPLREQITKTLEGDKPDLARYEAALEKLADGHVKMHVDMVRFSQQALEVLNAEQRSNMRYGMHLMRGMMGAGATHGGMMATGGCPSTKQMGMRKASGQANN
jgi:Spy/CpxP family protein refolding chaperone